MPDSLTEQVRDFLISEKMISQGELALVAFSGGPDSLVLLHVLNRLKEKLGLSLAAAHFDHGLRGEESSREAQAAAEICRSWDIPFILGRWERDKEGERSAPVSEDAARKARLRFLEETQKSLGAAVIATGHHRDDQAETVLIRLINGTGLTGLAGIRPVRRPYIRPLLKTGRQEILDYCREWELTPQWDSSNDRDDYLRNRLRHQVMPLLLQENPRFSEGISRMTDLLRQEEEFLDRLARQALAELEAEGPGLSLVGLKSLEPALARRVIRLWLGGETDAAGVERILALARQGRSGACAEASGGYRVRRSYERLELASPREGRDSRPVIRCLLLPYDENAALALAGGSFRPDDFPELYARLREAALEAASGNGSGEVREAYFCPWKKDWERPAPRFRRPGDWMLLPGGRKKLKELLIDQKIPREERDGLPLLAWEDQVLWVPGVARGRISGLPERTDCLLAFYY